MMVLIRFWRSLNKKDNVKRATVDMKYNIFFYFISSFRTFSDGSGFFRIGSGFFRIGSGLLADPDMDSESDPDPE